MTNNVDPDQTAPIGAVCSGSTLLASILNSTVMLGNYLQQTTSADNIFGCIFFLRVNPNSPLFFCPEDVCILHCCIFQVHFRLDFLMEANNMYPDQTVPLGVV